MTALTQPARWPFIALIASAALLAGAHVFEAMGYEPCLLCLRQREIHWVALTVAAIGAAILWRWPDRRFMSAVNAALGAIFLTSAVVAGYHAGVEYGFWPGPAACAVSGGGAAMSGGDILAALEGPVRMPSCSEAPWSLLGISMAGYNALISALLTLGSAIAAIGAERIGRPVHA